MKIAVASGKGGTGKTTISTILAFLLAKNGLKTALLDCDVEEPNCHIFFETKLVENKKIFSDIPKIDYTRCNFCGTCVKICQFNAMAIVKNKILIFDELCHSCGSCILNCPNKALITKPREIGSIEKTESDKIDIFQGRLRIGEYMASPLIKAVKKSLNYNQYKFVITDSPPGTSCSMISAINDADYVILVCEPTAFGFNDLKLAISVVKKLNKPFGILINKSSDNDKLIKDYATKNNFNILFKIPESIEFARAYSTGSLMRLNSLHKYFNPLIDKFLKNYV